MRDRVLVSDEDEHTAVDLAEASVELGLFEGFGIERPTRRHEVV
jgi:hypothetical protein